MTTARHQYVDPMAKPKPSKVKFVSTWNDRERRTVRILMLAVAIFAVIVAIGGYYLIDVGSQTQKTIKDGRQARIDFQNSIQNQANQNKKAIQELACYAANAVPRGTSHFLDGLAKKYNCPPYQKSAGIKASPSHNPAAVSSPINRSSNDFSTSTVVPGGGAGQTSSPAQPSGGGSSSTPGPKPNPTPTGVICKLLGLPC